MTQSFADAVLAAEKVIADAAHVNSAQDLAEGYDYLAGSIQATRPRDLNGRLRLCGH